MYKSSPILRWRRYNDRYRLEGNKCSDCGKIFYPKKHLCPCGSAKFEPKILKGAGKLLTYTEVKAPGENFVKVAPYLVGIIELEDGPRITSQIVDSSLKELEIGMPVQSTFRKFYESGKKGVLHYGLKFMPKF